MAFPTIRFPSWATDGGADVTDPGSSKQATGWIEGEAPAADHTNWLHNTRGDWINYLFESLAPYIAHSSRVLSGSRPWGTSTHSRWIGQYLHALDRFYAIEDNSAASDAITWDSTDGITWSSSTTIDSAVTEISNFTDDGTNLYVIADNVLYRSTTGLVTNLASFDTLPAIAGTGCGLVYDKVNSRFIYTADGTIYSSADGLTWDSYTVPDGPMTLAHNPQTGFTVANQIDSGTLIGDFFYSTDGGVIWATDTSGTTMDNMIYAASCQCFVGRDSSTGVLRCSRGDDVAALWDDMGIEADAFVNTPEFLYMWNDTGTDDHKGWYAFRNRAGEDVASINAMYLGSSDYTSDVHSNAINTTNSYFCGGNTTGKTSGFLCYPYSSNKAIAYSQYGPKIT